uniref:Reverse transcriptase domain-containing protein n=1 Tax=Lactuca sativa TaxID=4236 RepID=A0A9R1W2Y0_LACSA|nr:hypothetical protein LSAT_V11C300110250 [Lactuca sativa]
MGFDNRWIKLIFACLNSAKVFVLINGNAAKEFKLHRGVRQGDPLSSFLFIIVVEALKIAISEAMEKGIHKGVTLPNSGPTISLFQYVDDAIFLGEWSKENASNLLRILRCFYRASGLKVNLSKSKVYGIGVSNTQIGEMANWLNCSVGEFPFIYLGTPMSLIDKFNNKLPNWKDRNLSFGGRLVLCKAVLGTKGSYLFSLFKAPLVLLIVLRAKQLISAISRVEVDDLDKIIGCLG